MESNYGSFLVIWNLLLWAISGIMILSGIINLFRYYSRLTRRKTYKEKHDFIRDNESKAIFYTVIYFGVAVTLVVNTLQTETVVLSLVWFFLRLFISAGVGTLILYIGYLMLKYSYPARLHKKLQKLRYNPRINPKTGNYMKLLSEEEEDVHLDEGMQAEENVFSVDYDVWVDEETGDVHIEKYPGHLQAYQCNTCGFQTMRQIKEEILLAPTENTDGEIERFYECGYCGARRHKVLKVARLSQDLDNYKLPDELHFKEEDRVRSVTVEIYIGKNKKKIYDFPNTEQASRFLKEFELENT